MTDANKHLPIAALPTPVATKNDLSIPQSDVSTPVTPQTQEPAPLTSFTCFMKLPAELRSKVWTLALLAPKVHIIRPNSHSCSPTNAIVYSCKEAHGEGNRLALDYYVFGPDGICRNYINLKEDTFFISLAHPFEEANEIYLRCGECAQKEGHCQVFNDNDSPAIRRLVFCQGRRFENVNYMGHLIDCYKTKEVFVRTPAGEVDVLVDVDEDADLNSMLLHPTIDVNTWYPPSPTSGPNWKLMAERSMKSLRLHREAMKREDEEIAADSDSEREAEWLEEYGSPNRLSSLARDVSLYVTFQGIPDEIMEQMAPPINHQFRLLTSQCYHLSEV